MNRTDREAMAHAAVSLCNEAMQQWVQSTINLEGGPLTCALAACLMPKGVENILSKHIGEVDAARIMEKARGIAQHCVIAVDVQLVSEEAGPS